MLDSSRIFWGIVKGVDWGRMTNAIHYTDELLREYLLFRGFTATLKQFELEKKNDKMKGFTVCVACIYLGLINILFAIVGSI